MATKTTMMLILDACRADYLERDEAPFLRDLARRSLVGGFVSPPGFAQRTTMFTGTYPDTSGNLSAFGYDPVSSPFRWTRRLGPLMRMYRPRKLMYPARLALKHATRLLTGAFHTDPAWIPGPFLPHFAIVEDTRPVFDPGALPFTSVFDLLRASGKSFFYGAHPVSGDDAAIHRMLMDRIERRDPIDFYVAQFSALDEGGHHHGPLLPDGWRRAHDQRDDDVDRMRRALVEIDRKCATLHAALRRSYDEVDFLVLGDHGMAPVRRRVDVLAALGRTDLRAGRDYVVFLDSTFAKFWIETPRAREIVPQVLDALQCGRILTEDDKAQLRIRMPGRRYGDMMFVADPGVLFWPDYFHVVEHTIRGMHGYVDKREETVGALLLDSGGRAGGVGERSLVDVFPTLCDLLGLEIPKTNEGVSLLAPRGA